MNSLRQHSRYRGAALLTVLFILMVISVLTLGVLVRTDMDLAGSRNVPLRMQMDELAQSGMEYSKVLIGNQIPDANVVGAIYSLSDIIPAYEGSEYYQLAIVPKDDGIAETPNYWYTVDCEMFEEDGTEIANTRLQGDLRLPCIAYWQGGAQNILYTTKIYGDVYCTNAMDIFGRVYGDIYSTTTGSVKSVLMGAIFGQIYTNWPKPPVEFPTLKYEWFDGCYYVDSEDSYWGQEIVPDDCNELEMPGLNPGNDMKVYYHYGDLRLNGDFTAADIGTLAVSGNLTLAGETSLEIVSENYFPALIVGGDLILDGNNCLLQADGLVQVGNHIDMGGNMNGKITINGSLCVYNNGIVNCSGSSSITIQIDPIAGTVRIWDNLNSELHRWSPAGGGFYKSITRVAPDTTP